MRPNSSRATTVAVTVATAWLGALLLATACTSPVDSFVYLGKPEAGAGSFVGPDDASSPDGEADALETPLLQCIATTCPDGYATCASEDRLPYKCGTDLKHDADNCGSCGNKCLHYDRIHMTSRCIEGSCELECWTPVDPSQPRNWRDCNGKVDDGCEADLLSDERHCGACSNACPGKEPCIDGRCGCAAGTVNCNGKCAQLDSDDLNCGTCGIQCDGTGPCELPEGAHYGCGEGECARPKCDFPRGDCNGDLNDPDCNSDGCETPNIFLSVDNCGECGKKCNTEIGEDCVDEGNGPECAVPCARFGQTRCAFQQCHDLLNDPDACGSCSFVCPPASTNQARACRKGICELDCLPGFGDCNGDPSDGCETNLMAHPGNCGACGNSCDLVGGQPCIDGKCLMTECDAGGIK